MKTRFGLTALAIAAAFAMLLPGWPAVAQQTAPPTGDVRGSSRQSSVDQVGTSVGVDWTAGIRCAAPQSHDEADWCVQRRMATAAEEGLFLGYMQLLMGALGFIGLLVTIYFSRRATTAAISASHAAREAVHIERAWVTQTDVTARFGDPEKPDTDVLSISFELQNTGRSPALQLRSCVLYEMVDRDAEDFTFDRPYDVHAASNVTTNPDAKLLAHGPLGPNGKVETIAVTLTEMDYLAFTTQTLDLCIYCCCDYLDVFSTETRVTEFQVRVSHRGYEYARMGHAITIVHYGDSLAC